MPWRGWRKRAVYSLKPLKRLDVAFALTGEMWRAGDRVRITTQLIALPAEKVRQSASFDESIGRLSSLPQAIALKAIDALN